MRQSAPRQPPNEDSEISSASKTRAPTINLPKGGGAIRGIGEKFTANPVTGTGSMSIPIATSPGRGGLEPQLSLNYSSGSGSGPFGFGWSLPLPAITRKTDKGIPRYRDAAKQYRAAKQTDVFVLSGAEDLVPVDIAAGGPFEDFLSAPCYVIHRFRPRIEGLFARIERWTKIDDVADVHWRSLSQDNLLTIYGKDSNSRVCDPDSAERIFSWLICETRDDKGNAVVYDYKREDGKGVDLSRANEFNRGDELSPKRQVNQYLKRIRYGNRVSLLNNAGHRSTWLTPTEVADAAWMFEVVFDYGEHDVADPKPYDLGEWSPRLDPFSSYRSGFEVRTYRLCRRVLMFHHFPNESDVGPDCLVRSTSFDYTETPVATFIAAVTQSAFKRASVGGYLVRSLPRLELNYSQPNVGQEIRDVDPESIQHLPVGSDSAGCHWVDLDGEGLSGILREEAGSWFYKRNQSPLNRTGNSQSWDVRFSPVERVEQTARAATLTDHRWQLLDLAGDGRLDLVEFERPLTGFYERSTDCGWKEFQAFASNPNLPWHDPNLKFIDLTGDGLPDILIAEDYAFTWYPSLGEKGFGEAERLTVATDEEYGPRCVFSDKTQAIFLADFSGDGLTDIVRISNGEICYWPNLGYGRFGAKIAMDRAPRFDATGQFDPQRIRLADIDGSGVTDVVYLGVNETRFWFNEAGNAWSTAHELIEFPLVDDFSSVVATDLLGNGTACLVWSSRQPGAAEAPMKYLALMADGKPNLLVGSRNNLGAETRIQYAPSTYFYLRDEVDGQPWISRLPFPVHVVERVETYDHVSRNRFVTRYAYHHGYFDPDEREFRGFGRVDQWDTEEISSVTSSGALSLGDNIDATSYVAPVLTKTWYHTGVYFDRNHISDFFAGLLDAGDQGEYYREPGQTDAQVRESRLQDTLLPVGLTAAEEREASRALKGMMLRQEVYARDDTAKQKRPYAVTEQNFAVVMIQPRRNNRHGVFLVHPRETLSCHYERAPIDPRISHTLTLEVDEFGVTLKQVTVAYGRRSPDPVALPLSEDQDTQARTHIVYTENRMTGNNGISTARDYRKPLSCETCSFELTGYTPTGSAGRFQDSDFVKPDPADPSRALHIFDSEIDYEVAPTGGRERRMIEHLRTLYRPDDFGAALGDVNALLPLGKLGELALPGENYKLAFTPGLLQKIYLRDGLSLLPSDPGDVLRGFGTDRGGYVASQDLKATGGFPVTDADGSWWIPSGRIFHSLNDGDSATQERDYARAHFFLASRFRDPFGHATNLRFDGYDLLLLETRDPLGNRLTVGERLLNGEIDTMQPGNDYRLLQPWRIMDPNRNRTQVSFDILGMVVGTAVMGKPEESLGDSLVGFNADLPELEALAHLADPTSSPQAILGWATTRMVYDLFAYERTKTDPRPQSVVVYTLSREVHKSSVAPLKIQHGFAYSDGFGREIQRRRQAAPGPVPMRDGTGQVLLGPDNQPVMTVGDVSPRWIGTGWTVLNNKGKPVRQFEPFFTDTHRYEFDMRVGVSPILFYDPIGRVVATLNPDHTWAKTVFDPWHQETWDVADTVGIPDPSKDSDVGDFFARLAAAEYLPTWYGSRQSGALGPEEQAAALKTSLLADSPAFAHGDALGRTFLTVAHNKLKYSDTAPAALPIDEFYRSRVYFDIEGNTRSVADANNCIVTRSEYDMLGTRIRGASMEAGQRWMLMDVAGAPLMGWDNRGHRFRTEYDALRRPIDSFLKEGATAEIVTGRSSYGESLAVPEAKNLRGKTVEVFDQAGVVRSGEYDFKGNLLSSERQFAQAYKTTLDWSAPVPLNAEIYTNRTLFDALNRPVQLIAPHSNVAGARINVVQPGFNEASQLTKVDVWLDQASEPVGLRDPVTASLHAVKNISYDAKGQRKNVVYGNGVSTTYEHDPLTFRLIHMVTRRDAAVFPTDCPGIPPPGWPGCQIQNLYYTYDPAGNIVAIRDDAQQTIYFRNKRVEPNAEFTYDALSRLIEATGREHLGQQGGTPIPHSYNDLARIELLHPGDGNVMGRYLERYAYDAAGNFKKVQHVGTDPANPGWSRTYIYNEDSQLEAGSKNNRLTSTTVGSLTDTYSIAGNGYDGHGNMLRLPQLQILQWDHKDQLRMTQRQAVNVVDTEGVQRHGERTWYVYDASGQRVRKVTELATGQLKDERQYLSGFEIFRRFGINPLVRETLHIMDDKQRIALIETRTSGSEVDTPQQLVRFQFGNHLGSASLELDDQARIISYEEHSPYGSTSYQAMRSQTETPKRYRYTGKERDDESGFYYHGARYYAPWIGRWISCDPAGTADGANLYCYVANNPTNTVDLTGKDGVQPQKIPSFGERLQQGIEAGAKQAFDGLTHMPGSPLSIVGDVKTAIEIYDAFKQEKTVGAGLLMAANVLNPAYHAGVAGVESEKAASKGNYAEATVYGVFAAVGAVQTVLVAAGAARGITRSGPNVLQGLKDLHADTRGAAKIPFTGAKPTIAPPQGPATLPTGAMGADGKLHLPVVDAHVVPAVPAEKAMKGMVTKIAATLEAKPGAAAELLSENSVKAMSEAVELNKLGDTKTFNNLVRLLFGKAVEAAAKRSGTLTGFLESIGLKRDAQGKFTSSTDFKGQGPIGGSNVEVTSTPAVEAHDARGYPGNTITADYPSTKSWYQQLMK
jgi:RHS repeat-associated protein